MEIPPEEGPPHIVLLEQLQGSFATIYLTMLSIIQGVALADLANVVAGNFGGFTIVNWLLVVAEFWLILEVWTHFMTDATSKGWIPGYVDSVLFFGLGGGELFLNHAIALGLKVWLFGMVGAAAAGLPILLFIRWREEHDVDDEALLAVLRKREPLHKWHAISGTVIFGVAFLCCLLLNVEAHDLHGIKGAFAIGSGVLSAAWVGSLIVITAAHWNGVTHYARTGTELESYFVLPPRASSRSRRP